MQSKYKIVSFILLSLLTAALVLTSAGCSQEGGDPASDDDDNDDDNDDNDDNNDDNDDDDDNNDDTGGDSDSDSDSDTDSDTDSDSDSDSDGDTDSDSDGDWDEPMCPNGSLGAAESAYNGTNLKATSLAIAEARYPIAADWFTEETDSSLESWYADWPGEEDGQITFQEVLDRFNTAAHESCHGWDFAHGYKLIEGLTISMPSFDGWFYMSEIVKYHADIDSDMYADIYLLDSTMGDQEFPVFLSEYNAYTHSLAIGYCMYDDAIEWSGRDGALTFMYYIVLYLKTARLDYPDTYDRILGDDDVKRMVVLNWDRVSFWLDQTEAIDDLGIDDTMIASWLYTDENLEEIQNIRDEL